MAINEAQALILKHEGTFTTLTISIICPSSNERWFVCTAIVGDSNAYVYSQRQKLIFELTQGRRFSYLLFDIFIPLYFSRIQKFEY